MIEVIAYFGVLCLVYWVKCYIGRQIYNISPEKKISEDKTYAEFYGDGTWPEYNGNGRWPAVLVVPPIFYFIVGSVAGFVGFIIGGAFGAMLGYKLFFGFLTLLFTFLVYCFHSDYREIIEDDEE